MKGHAMRLSSSHIAVTLISVVILAVFGCTGHDTAGEIEGGELTLETVVVDTSAGDCAPDTNTRCAKLYISYPVVTGGVAEAVRDSVNTAIVDLVAPQLGGEGEETVQRAVEFFLGSFEETLDEFDDFNQSWRHRGVVTIRFSNDRMISLRADEFSYTGGAHPNSESRMIMLSLEDGSVLTVDDLLVDNWQPVIEGIALDYFRAANDIPDSLSLADAGYWGFEEGFIMPENMGVNGVGLAFHYNAYEVGPYSAGATDFTIPFLAIESLIDADGPLGE